MAMQASMGLSKAILLLGAAGFSIPVILRNGGKVSEILAEIQESLKGTESGADPSDLAKQVQHLMDEWRRHSHSSPQIIVGTGEGGNLSALVIPAATLGALGYGYMWWKGFSFSDLMYVTKRNMATAVSSMTKHLEQVSDALAKTKKHLTQRIENLDWKLDEQKQISGEIKNEVIESRGKLENIGIELNSLQQLVWGLDGKINAIESKQDFACAGVMYLCQFVEGKGGKMPNFALDGPPTAGKRRTPVDVSAKGLQHILQTIESGKYDKTHTESILQLE